MGKESREYALLETSLTEVSDGMPLAIGVFTPGIHLHLLGTAQARSFGDGHEPFVVNALLRHDVGFRRAVNGSLE